MRMSNTQIGSSGEIRFCWREALQEHAVRAKLLVVCAISIALSMPHRRLAAGQKTLGGIP